MYNRLFIIKNLMEQVLENGAEDSNFKVDDIKKMVSTKPEKYKRNLELLYGKILAKIGKYKLFKAEMADAILQKLWFEKEKQTSVDFVLFDPERTFLITYEWDILLLLGINTNGEVCLVDFRNGKSYSDINHVSIKSALENELYLVVKKLFLKVAYRAVQKHSVYFNFVKNFNPFVFILLLLKIGITIDLFKLFNQDVQTANYFLRTSRATSEGWWINLNLTRTVETVFSNDWDSKKILWNLEYGTYFNSKNPPFVMTKDVYAALFHLMPYACLRGIKDYLSRTLSFPLSIYLSDDTRMASYTRTSFDKLSLEDLRYLICNMLSGHLQTDNYSLNLFLKLLSGYLMKIVCLWANKIGTRTVYSYIVKIAGGARWKFGEEGYMWILFPWSFLKDILSNFDMKQLLDLRRMSEISIVDVLGHVVSVRISSSHNQTSMNKLFKFDIYDKTNSRFLKKLMLKYDFLQEL